MLMIIGTAGSREKNIVSGTNPAVNNNPTTTNAIFNSRSRNMLTSISSSQLAHDSADSDRSSGYSRFRLLQDGNAGDSVVPTRWIAQHKAWGRKRIDVEK